MIQSKHIILLMLSLCLYLCVDAQEQHLDTGVEVQFKERNDAQINAMQSPYRRMSDKIVGAALMISLISVIWNVASNGKEGKGFKYAIRWVVAVIIYMILRNFI